MPLEIINGPKNDPTLSHVKVHDHGAHVDGRPPAGSYTTPPPSPGSSGHMRTWRAFGRVVLQNGKVRAFSSRPITPYLFAR